MNSGNPRNPLPKYVALTLAIFALVIGHFSASNAPVSISQPKIAVATPPPFRATQESGALLSRVFLPTNAGSQKISSVASSSKGPSTFEHASASLSAGGRGIQLVAAPASLASPTYVDSVKIPTPNAEPEASHIPMGEAPAPAQVPIGDAERTFPADSGMVNVKLQFGAKGDGISDDTQAIQQAISSVVHHPQNGPRIIFFPSGIYLVSRPLLEKDLRSQWNSLLTLQGENRANTSIKLTDDNGLYQSVSAPNPVLLLASQHGTAKGGGNSAFDNNIYDMTIDVGRGNPGAIALDFMGNNYCALRNVTLRSSDPNHSGAVGLASIRYAAGPCLLKNVVIDGFDYGIKVQNNEYSLTFEDLTLLNQRRCGIHNTSNVINIRHLVSTNSVPAIYNDNPAGLITLIDANLRGGSSHVSAVQNHGTLYARNITSSGYAGVLENNGTAVSGASISEYSSGPRVSEPGDQKSLKLPVEETPHFEDSNLNNWKSVTAFGADATGKRDSSAAIQSAIDSGATTVYLPTGVYVVTKTIQLRGKVRVVEGFGSSVNPSGSVFQDPSHPVPIFNIEDGTAEVALNHMRIAAYYPRPCKGVVAVQQDSARPFVIRDSLIGGPPLAVAYQNTSRGTGTLFVENVAGTPWHILFPQSVFARQIDPEGNRAKIINKSGRLWILGLKTEGSGTNIDTEQGGLTELLGGLIYPVWKVPADTAGFVVNDSQASFVYAVSNYKPAAAGSNFTVQIQEIKHGVTKSLLSTSLPSRGRGTVVPLYRSADR